MSTYGRTWDAVVAVLEAYGIDPKMTTPKMYTRNEAGVAVPLELADELCDVAYRAAFNQGLKVANLRLQKALQATIFPPDLPADA